MEYFKSSENCYIKLHHVYFIFTIPALLKMRVIGK